MRITADNRPYKHSNSSPSSLSNQPNTASVNRPTRELGTMATTRGRRAVLSLTTRFRLPHEGMAELEYLSR